MFSSVKHVRVCSGSLVLTCSVLLEIPWWSGACCWKLFSCLCVWHWQRTQCLREGKIYFLSLAKKRFTIYLYMCLGAKIGQKKISGPYSWSSRSLCTDSPTWALGTEFPPLQEQKHLSRISSSSDTLYLIYVKQTNQQKRGSNLEEISTQSSLSRSMPTALDVLCYSAAAFKETFFWSRGLLHIPGSLQSLDPATSVSQVWVFPECGYTSAKVGIYQGAELFSQKWIIRCPLEVLQAYRAVRGDLNVDFILSSGLKCWVVGTYIVQCWFTQHWCTHFSYCATALTMQTKAHRV